MKLEIQEDIKIIMGILKIYQDNNQLTLSSIEKTLGNYLSLPKQNTKSITDSDIERIMLEIDEAKEQIRKYLSSKK